jgi:hypothetical protein
VAAAILEAFQLYPGILHEQANFLGPGLRAVQIGEKGPGTGAVLAFLTHTPNSFRLPLGLNIPGVTGDHVQFHAVVQLFLGGVFGAFEGVQGPFIARAILNFPKALAALNGFRHENLLYPMAYHNSRDAAD